MAYDATKTMSVRCVAPAWEARQIYVRPGFDFFKPVIKGDPRVPDAFADLGDMYESVGLIWSAAVPNRTWYKAESFCKDLGGEARLPSVSEWEALGQAMSKNGKYNPGLLPSAGRGPFWTSFMDPGNNNTDCAKYFNIDGSISCCRIQPDNRGREFSFFSVRCVIKPPKTGASEVDSSSCCSVM